MYFQMWQHPYVNVFRHFDVGQWKKSAKEGDVTTCMDKAVKGTVFKITGVIPANNYIQLPKTGSQSLGLTGRYVYLAFKPVPERYFVMHIDVASTDGLTIRISFSNLFKEFKSTSTWLQFPFVVTAAQDSVEYQASRGSKQAPEPCAAPFTTRWTLLILDLQYMLSIYLNRAYSHVKTVRMCANTLVKGLYTSDNYYEPGISIDEAKKLGLPERGIQALPREMAFPLHKSDKWHEKYDLIRFPSDSNKTPIEYLQKFGEMSVAPPSRSSSSSAKHRSGRASPAKGGAVTEKISAVGQFSNKSTRSKPQSGATVLHKKAKSTASQLPEVGLDEDLHINGVQIMRENAIDDKENEFEPREIHVVPKSSDSRKQLRSKKVPSAAKSKSTQSGKISTGDNALQRVRFPLNPDICDMGRNNYRYKGLQPDPIIKLKKVIGFGGAAMNQAVWTNGGNYIVYPCHALVVAIHASTGRQRFFIGHTEKVSCISLTRDSSLLASGQTGQNCCVRIWNYKTADCLSVFKVNATALHTLDFSESGSILAAAGRDSHNKTLITVWNTSRVLKGGEVNLLAKAHTEVEVAALKISPADDARLVSCGRNNIRLWRLKDNSLRSAAVPLGEHHLMEFNDICWDFEPSISAEIRTKTADERKIYACSRSGHIFEVDHKRMAISDVHRLLPRNKDGEKQTMSSGSGISINSIYANDTFCVTGSSDGFLRVWPLDFKHVYLEAEHDGPVSVVQMSDNGLKILAGTCTGNLGVLDVTTRSYQTLMRSHTDRILHMSQDVFRHHMATVSSDQTIRVWSQETGQQLYDFHAPNECPTNICYHPSKQLFTVGFDNGSVRVFDIQATSLVADHCSHKGSVTGLAYTGDGCKMFSCAADGTLCSYDSSDDTYPVIRLLGGIVAKGAKYSPDALTVSPHGHFLAFVGPQNFTVTAVSTKTLDEVMRIDVTTVTSPVEAARGLIDTACRVYYTPSNTNHLLVSTENSRLLKFDAPTGKLVAEISNIHREPCTGLDISRSGRHLVTAGDRVLKVWDYQMRLDLNFQVFIGQSESINKVSFTPSYNEIISCGEAIFVWQFLGEEADDECEESEEEEVSIVRHKEDLARSSDNISNRRSPNNPRSPSHRDSTPKKSSPSARRSLNTSLTAMPRRTAPRPCLSPQRTNSAMSGTLAALTPLCDSQKRNVMERDDRRPADVLVEKELRESINTQSYGSPRKPTRNSQLLKPTSNKHFIPTDKVSTFAQKRYVAPADQAGLRLASCIGYNGNGRDNIIWQPETGFFAYTNGCVVVVEDLKSGEQKHLLGHVEEVSTLAVQSDCQEMVSASGNSRDSTTNSQLCFWDLTSMTCRKVINEHECNIVSLAYSRDDRFLISIGDYQERRINLWETCTCTLVASTITCQPLHYVAWDPQAFNEFVTVGDSGAIMFWLVDEVTDKVPKLRVQEPTIPDEILCLAPKVDFTCASYAGDRILYVGSNIGVISAWDTKKNVCLLHWEADKCEISSIIARRGRLVTGSASKKCLRIWSVPGVSELLLPGNTISISAPNVQVEDEISLDGFVTAMMFDETLDMGIVGSDCGTIWYVNWQEHSSVRLVTTNPTNINAVEFSGDGSKFVTCADDGSVRLWLVEDREQLLQFQVLDQKCSCAAFAPCFEKTIVKGLETQATFTIDGKRMAYNYLAAGYGDGTLRVFDTNKAEMVMKIQPHRACVAAILYGSGSILISGDEAGFIALTSTLTGMTIRIINDHKGAPIHNINMANWKADDGSVCWLACSADRRVSVWSADWSKDTCTLLDWLTFPAPSFGPDGRRNTNIGAKAYYCSLPPSIAEFSTSEKDVVIYTGYGMTKSVQFYDLRTKAVTRTISLTHWARCMTMSPMGSLIATGINERLVKIHDYNEGTFQDYIGHDDAISIIKFSPNGQNLLSVVNKSINLWDVLL